MVLLATLIDSTGEIRLFSLVNAELEIGFEVLNKLIKEGSRLVDARILYDNHSWTPLPVDAFDGEPCQQTISQMMLGCQLLLGQYTLPEPSAQPLPAPSRINARNFHQMCIFRLELFIPYLNFEIDRVQQSNHSEDSKRPLVNQLMKALGQYQSVLTDQKSLVQDY